MFLHESAENDAARRGAFREAFREAFRVESYAGTRNTADGDSAEAGMLG